MVSFFLLLFIFADNNNYGGCAWDGGDCCGAKANIKYCKGASVDFLNLRLGLPLGWSRKARFALLFISLVNAECECKDCTKKKAKSCPGKAKGCSLPKYKGDENCDDENVRLDSFVNQRQ